MSDVTNVLLMGDDKDIQVFLGLYKEAIAHLPRAPLYWFASLTQSDEARDLWGGSYGVEMDLWCAAMNHWGEGESIFVQMFLDHDWGHWKDITVCIVQTQNLHTHVLRPKGYGLINGRV